MHKKEGGLLAILLAKNCQKNSVQLITLVLYKFYNNFHYERVLLEGMLFVVEVA